MKSKRKLAQSTTDKLQYQDYRRFLMMTCAWPGKRAFPGSLIIKLNTNADGIPLFWCGHIGIANYFALDRPIYGLLSSYDVKISSTFENIRNMSAHYVNEILKIQHQGPYFLGGYCDGCFVAYEIAQQLIQKGYRVDFLVLIEREIEIDGLIQLMVKFIYKIINKIRSVLDRNYLKNNNISQSISAKSALILCRARSRLFSKLLKVVKETLHFVVNVCNLNFISILRCPNDFSQTSSLFKSNQFSFSQKTQLYTFKPIQSKVVHFYVKWGPFGYYRFKMFQKNWRRIALQGVDFHMISGKHHMNFDFLKIAEKINLLYQDGANDMEPQTLN